jgi:hypothetical protein
VKALRARSCLLDGEAVVCDEHGLAVFERLRYRRDDHSVLLFAFGLLELDGQDLRREPFETRKATLASLLRGSMRGRYVGKQALQQRGVHISHLYRLRTKRRSSDYTATLRADARGCDGGVREELAEGVGWLYCRTAQATNATTAAATQSVSCSFLRRRNSSLSHRLRRTELTHVAGQWLNMAASDNSPFGIRASLLSRGGETASDDVPAAPDLPVPVTSYAVRGNVVSKSGFAVGFEWQHDTSPRVGTSSRSPSGVVK